MTTKTVFGIKDPNTTQNEKITSRIASLQSVLKQQAEEIKDINKDISNLDATFDNLELLYKRLTRALNVIQWAAKEMIVIMNILCMQYIEWEKTITGSTCSQSGRRKIVGYPDKWVWTELYKIYAPYIPGGLYQ
jgi:chromosome segregation ATPase